MGLESGSRIGTTIALFHWYVEVSEVENRFGR